MPPPRDARDERADAFQRAEGFRPAALPVYGDLPPPPGYVLEERVNTGLIVGGAITFGAMYAVTVGYAASEGFEGGLGWAAVPIFGPWVALAQRDFSCNVTLDVDSAEECQNKVVDEAATLAVLAGLGMGQMVGGVLTLVGVLDRESLWVREDVLGARLQLDMRPQNADLGLRLHGSF